jgi:uncharacterized membrane protein
MASKDKHVVIGYFPSSDAADAAAKQLKEWDKAYDDIKLGGIGILTAKNGKIKTHKVGRRATGTGAKWGLALGAVTGILSGGVTLIGGAVAGVVGGAVLGALFHKSLGFTDADKERLDQHLQNGGAAVVVMADAHELKPTMAELVRLGGEVENYTVPEETMDQVERSAEVARVAGDAADDIDDREIIAEEDMPAIVGLGGRLGTVEGIGPARNAALAAIGLRTKQELLQRGATPEGRAEIAAQSEISEKLIAGWVSAIDLSRVKGIGAQYGELLQAAGVNTVGDLAQQEAASLHEQMRAVNTTRNLVGSVPSAAQVAVWIDLAKGLPQVVTA